MQMAARNYGDILQAIIRLWDPLPTPDPPWSITHAYPPSKPDLKKNPARYKPVFKSSLMRNRIQSERRSIFDFGNSMGVG